MRPFIVSTDCSGILGYPKLWHALWENVLAEPGCKGVEMIGWRWTPRLIEEAKRYGIHIVGIHGPTAGWDEDRELQKKIVLSTLNQCFMSFQTFLDQAPKSEYLLLHRSTITTKLLSVLQKERPHLKTLYIENVITKDDLGKTVETISYLKSEGFHAGIMFDVVHFLREPYFDAPQITRFDGLIDALHRLSHVTFPVSIHFPIGTYTNDSLPLKKITNGMWKELSHAIKKVNPKYIVLENQQERAYSLALPGWARQQVRDRNKRIVSLLMDHEIL